MFRKTQTQLIVSLPSPCHENWQEMAQAERGRFCQACQTVVTDFTGLSDDEIIKHIEHAAGGKMCGRFLTNQTDRVLLPEIKVHRISTFRKIAATVLMFYASVNEAVAQAPIAKHNTYTSAHTKKPTAKITGITISGKVIDFTGQGMPHLELQIVGSDSIKTTDAYGRFKFRLPGNFSCSEVVISPTKNGARVLDSIGATMQEAKTYIDTVPFKTSIVINLYPIDTLQEMDIVEKYQVERAMISSGGSILIVTSQPPKKETAWKKFRNFFKPKKGT